MRRANLRRAGVGGTIVVAGLLGTLLVAGQTAAQYPTYPTTPSSPSPKAGSVGITGTSTSDYGFQPRTLKVKKGTRVTWAWQSNAPHNVTFTKSGQKSRTGQTETFKHRFKKAGTFRYFCSVHGFTGKIVVRK
jgi:plastocyanin